MPGIALILPPGWTLHPGGPHIALPLLKGFLQHHNIETKIHDLNIGSTQYHRISISEDSVVTACKDFTAKAMNSVYFEAEDKLQKLAKDFDGTWFAHEGYRRNDCNLASPADIESFSRLESPFTAYLKKKAIPEILGQDPQVIGISITVPTQILQVFEIARLLREAKFDGSIVLGGNIVTRLYEDMALSWVFDIVDGLINLQGEEALLQIYQSLTTHGDLRAVPNLTWRCHGTITRNQSKLLSPSKFQQPDFADLPHQEYWGTKYLTMVAGRGCYYGKCSFCAIPFGYGKAGFIGSSPAFKVVEAMKEAYQMTGINRFKFIDEALHHKMMQDLADVLEHEASFSFEAYLRLEKTWMDKKLLHKSAKAGLKKVYLGLELITSDERGLLNKADQADPLIMLNNLKDAGIKSHVFCMFGFPGTGVKQAFDTIEFAFKHHDLIDTLDIFPFYYARHTQVEGVSVTDDPHHTWNVEHKYEPASSSTLPPSKVNILAEELGQLAWSKHPQWFHPVYRMYSPWHVN